LNSAGEREIAVAKRQERQRTVERQSRTPVKLFLVEDSALICERLSEELASAGRIEVVGTAETESAAIAELQGLQCDAIILDLDLKQGNGFGVLKWVRAGHRGPRPLVIVFTNYSYPEYRNESMRLGADFFFDKGQDFDRVRETIEKFLPADGGRST